MKFSSQGLLTVEREPTENMTISLTYPFPLSGFVTVMDKATVDARLHHKTFSMPQAGAFPTRCCPSISQIRRVCPQARAFHGP
jgi:hypothetical protein